MKKRNFYSQGFTLIELLIVIFIIAILTGLAMTNFLGARERARDSKKKAELQQLKTALRLYYNDFGKYPNHDPGPLKTKIYGCGADGTLVCAQTCTPAIAEFAAGGDGCSTATVYMKKIPFFTTGTMQYFQLLNGDDFLAKALLENKADPDAAVTNQRCPGSGSYTCGASNYCVCGD